MSTQPQKRFFKDKWMEDFQAAFLQRDQDVETLHEKQRYILSMHIGGVAVECLLKAKLCAILPTSTCTGEKEWYDSENGKNVGHTIRNPGHIYRQALRSHQRLHDRVKGNPYVWQWLEKVENPECHFIDMRYVGKEPDKKKYESWYDAYRKLVRWLLKQKF